MNSSPKHIFLIAMGSGGGSLTLDARAALESAQCVIGSRRLLGCARPVIEFENRRCYALTGAEEICRRISDEDAESFAVLFSGDTGFFSGAKRLLPLLRERGWERTVIPGVSSPALLAARLGCSWEDAALISLHGRRGSSIAACVMRNAKSFFLTDGERSARFVCSALCEAGMGNLVVHIGELLGSSSECISSGSADSFAGRNFDALSVVMVENPAPFDWRVSVLPDDFFVRGDVPMSKSEVRAVSLDKLCLTPQSVVWDVGAGTGAVACDAARRAGDVFAVEKEHDALELIRCNRERLGLGNLCIVAGRAPAALEALPPPDEVFIGGSSGELAGIFETVMTKNPAARIVINAITPETAVEASALTEQYDLNDRGMIQLAISKAEKAGRSHLLKASNPVFIIWGGGTAMKKAPFTF